MLNELHNLPSVLQPSGSECYPIFIPDDSDYRELLLGALAQLTNAEYYRENSWNLTDCETVANEWLHTTYLPFVTALQDQSPCGSSAVPEYCRVYTTSSIVIPNSVVYNPVSFSSLRYQSSGFWQLADPTKLIVPASLAGLYTVFANVNWNSASGGNREMYLRVNGGTYIAATSFTQSASFESPMALSTQHYFNANDYVELCVRVIGAGSARSLVTGGNYGQEFGLAKVG